MSTNASWQQAANLLTLVSNKGTPAEQIQKLYSSGLLADLLDANVDEVNRDEFRKVLGLDPVWKTDKYGHILITVTGLGLTAEEWKTRLEGSGYRFGDWARNILGRLDYDEKHRVEAGKQYTVALVLGKEIKKDNERSTANLKKLGERYYGRSADLKGELALLIREAISDEQMERFGVWYIAVLHEPITDSGGDPLVLYTYRRDRGRWVHAYWDKPGYTWRDGGAFAFPVSQ